MACLHAAAANVVDARAAAQALRLDSDHGQGAIQRFGRYVQHAAPVDLNGPNFPVIRRVNLQQETAVSKYCRCDDEIRPLLCFCFTLRPQF